MVAEWSLTDHLPKHSAILPFLSGAKRSRIPDGDFIDIDHIPACAGIRSGRVAILSHGLEGNSTRRYMLGMAEALNRRGWDVVARNFRGCSGEMNHTLQLYHGGETTICTLSCSTASPSATGASYLWGSAWAAIKTLKYLGEQDRISLHK